MRGDASALFGDHDRVRHRIEHGVTHQAGEGQCPRSLSLGERARVRAIFSSRPRKKDATNHSSPLLPRADYFFNSATMASRYAWPVAVAFVGLT